MSNHQMISFRGTQSRSYFSAKQMSLWVLFALIFNHPSCVWAISAHFSGNSWSNSTQSDTFHPLAADHYHLCGLKSGQIFCQPSPNGLAPLFEQIQTVVSFNHSSCLLEANGKMECWGDDSQMRRGITALNQLKLQIKAVYTGPQTLCALSAQTLFCIGDTEWQPNTKPRTGDITLEAIDKTVNAIAIGDGFICFARNKKVSCKVDPNRAFPSIPNDLSADHMVAAKSDPTLCSIEKNSVRCFDDGGEIQLALPKFKNPRELKAGNHHFCLTDDRGLVCWNTRQLDFDAAKVPTDLPPFSSYELGSDFTCALLKNFQVRCWGGLRDFTVLQKKDFRLAAGQEHICAFDTDTVSCVGDNRYSQLQAPIQKKQFLGMTGAAGSICAYSSNRIQCAGEINDFVPEWPTVTEVSALAIQNVGLCVIAGPVNQHRIECFGSGANDPRPPLDNPLRISASDNAYCAAGENRMNCWGASAPEGWPLLNSSPKQLIIGLNLSCLNDRLGLACWGDSLDHFLPEYQEPGLFTEIALGRVHGCGLTYDHRVLCWGGNFSDQLKVPTLAKPTHIFAADDYTCVVDGPKNICWGEPTP